MRVELLREALGGGERAVRREWAAVIGKEPLKAVHAGLAAAVTAQYTAERPTIRPAM